MANSLGGNRDLVAGRGRQRGEQTGTGTAAYAGTECGAQGRAAEAGNVQVCGALNQERRWGGVKIERDSKRKSRRWGGGRKERGKKDQ